MFLKGCFSFFVRRKKEKKVLDEWVHCMGKSYKVGGLLRKKNTKKTQKNRKKEKRNKTNKGRRSGENIPQVSYNIFF